MDTSGHHESLVERQGVRPPSERSFGITFTVVFALLAAWLFLRKGLPIWGSLSLICSVLFLVAAFVNPVLLTALNRAWFRLGLMLHKIVNPIVMGLLFFLVFTPTGIVMRLIGKDLLGLKRTPIRSSYWIRRDAETDPLANMRNQY